MQSEITERKSKKKSAPANPTTDTGAHHHNGGGYIVAHLRRNYKEEIIMLENREYCKRIAKELEAMAAGQAVNEDGKEMSLYD